MQELIAQKIREVLVEVGGLPMDFSADADIYADLGMPSVKAMQLLLELEDRFGVALPDEDFVEVTTLNGLAGLLLRVQQQSA